MSTILKEDFSDYKKGQRFLIGKIKTLNQGMHKSLYGFMIPSEKLCFDTTGYLVKQKIMSCYDWDVNYHYENATKLLKIHSNLEGQKSTYGSTSYYWFDHLNRITKIHRIIYKDLYCMYEHKQVLYDDTSFIPSKIYSEQKSRTGVVHERGIESFYKSNTGLDSIHIDFIKIGTKPNLGEKIVQTYHFAPNGMVQNINNGKYDVQYHYYEKKRYKKQLDHF